MVCYLRSSETDMKKKTLVFLLSVMCTLWWGATAPPVKFQGQNLCILEEFLTNVDKVAISEIQVEDIQFLPLATSPVNLEGVDGDPKASVVVIRRNLLGSGAHRELEIDVSLKLCLGESESPEECDLILFEKLSNGVFADPFQLQRFQKQGAFKKVHIYGDTDLERPARTSYPSVVEVHTAVLRKGASLIGAQPKEYRVKVLLPLHARYPPISEESHFQLNISMPQVMVKCHSREGTSNRNQDTCMRAYTDLPPESLHWYIPAGSPLHSTLVDSVTTAAAVIGVVAVFLAAKKSILVSSESTQGSISS